MPAPANADELIDLIRKSGVVEEARLSAYLQQLSSGTGIPKDVSKFAGVFVRDGLLTFFQAEQFLLGKWKRFTIGKYKVLERIGSGGMGQVFLCEHKLMRRKVAVKVLPTGKSDDSSSLDRFYREARAVAALDHPNIVRAYDIDQDENLHFLVMEYVDGASLQELVKKFGPMDVTRACHYIYWAAIGLQHAHEAGLIHRDIKPGNILVDRTGTVKILDLGLARFFNDDQDLLTKKYDENVLGTADYLAPEQAIDSHSVDGRADIYSLGATFYFMLTGCQPFTEGTVAQKLIWHQTRHPKAIREIRAEVPEGVVALVEKMMAKDPNDRYQNPMELAEALSPFVQTPIGPPPDKEMPQLSAAAQAVGGGPVSMTAPRPVPPPLPRSAGGSGASKTGGSDSRRRTAAGSGRGAQPTGPVVSDSEQTRRRSVGAPVVEKMPTPKQESGVWESLANETNDVAKANTERPSGRNPKSGRKAKEPEPLPLPESKSKSRINAKPYARKQKSAVPYIIAGLALLAIGASYAVYHFVFRSPAGGKGGEGNPNVVESARVTVSRLQKDANFPRLRDALQNAREGQHIVILDSLWDEELKIGRDISSQVKGVTIEGGIENRGVVWKFRDGQSKRKMIEMIDAAGLTVRNLTFEGSPQVNYGIIAMGECPGLTIEDVTFRDLRDAAVRFDSCKGAPTDPVTVQRCQFIGNKTFQANTCGVLFEGTQTVQNVPAPPDENIAIRDCRFEGPFSKDNREGAINIAASVAGIDIVRNRFWSTGDGVYFKQAKPNMSYRVRITNNTFHSLASGLHFSNAGFLASRLNAANFKIDVERNYFFNVQALTRTDDKYDGTLSPLQSAPSDNARNLNSKEGVVSLNTIPREPGTPFSTNPDEEKTFLRYPKNSPLIGPPVVGAGPVE